MYFSVSKYEFVFEIVFYYKQLSTCSVIILFSIM
jgi:hypothetical protein